MYSNVKILSFLCWLQSAAKWKALLVCHHCTYQVYYWQHWGIVFNKIFSSSNIYFPFLATVLHCFYKKFFFVIILHKMGDDLNNFVGLDSSNSIEFKRIRDKDGELFQSADFSDLKIHLVQANVKIDAHCFA